MFNSYGREWEALGFQILCVMFKLMVKHPGGDVSQRLKGLELGKQIRSPREAYWRSRGLRSQPSGTASESRRQAAHLTMWKGWDS